MGCFRAPKPCRKTAPLKRPIKRSMIFVQNCPEAVQTHNFRTFFRHFSPIWSVLLFGDPVQCSPVTKLVDKESRLEVPWTWERESRGQKPKGLQKSLEKVSRAGSPKSRNRSEKSKKCLKMGFFGLFGPFLETFWLLAPRLPLPGPRNLKSRPFS